MSPSRRDALLASLVVRTLRTASRPMTASELARRFRRRCTCRFREKLATFWLAGLIAQVAGGFVPGPRAAAVESAA